MDFKVRKVCPCCNFPITGKEKIIRGSLNSSINKTALRNVWMGIGKTQYFSYLKCKKCSALYNLEYPSDDLINELYSLMPPNMGDQVDSNNQIKNQVSYAKKILNGLKLANLKWDNYSFLEIGADRGLLINELYKLNKKKFEYCMGIEPNNIVKEELRENLINSSKRYSLHDDIEECDKNYDNKFNLAACIHILDHSFDPQKLLLAIRKKLVINGLLIIVVHNPNSTLAKILGNNWPAYCSQHPQLFSKKSINEISKVTGFEVIKQGRTVNNFALSMITSFFGMNLGFAKNINIKFPLGNRFYLLRKIYSFKFILK